MQVIYLDYNATTKLAPTALQKMQEAYELPLNNSSTHNFGRIASKLVEEARTEVKNILNAHNYEVTFTGSSTEATNTLFRGLDVATILVSKIEHDSVLKTRPQGKNFVEINVLQNGLIDLDHLKAEIEKLENANFLVSIMLANNETGSIQPVEEIAKITHQKGGLYHCDIVQAIGKIEVDLEKINADFASISAHKLNGPQGVGALLSRKALEFTPLITGGKQEKSKRAGTTNIAGIAGFGAACKLVSAKIKQQEEVKKLRDYLEDEICKIGGADVRIFCNEIARLPNTSYIGLRGTDSQTQLINFDLNNICVSAGPACSSGTLAESKVLKAMGISPEFSTSAIRVSLSSETTKAEVDRFIAVWKEFYERIKK